MDAGTGVGEDPPEDDAEDQKQMTFWDHVEELRRRLKVIVVAVLLLFGLCLTTYVGNVSIGGTQVPMLIPSLGPVNENVATQFFSAVQNDLLPTNVSGIPLNRSFQQPWDAYVVMFKIAFFLAIVAGSPVISFELGRFISPALKPSEKRLILKITVPILVLFLAGVLLCFFVVLPFTFRLLYSQQNLMGANLFIINGDNFVDFVLLFSLGFGLAFQLPVVMYGLSAVGILSADFWKRHWRIATAGIFIFGALITPDGSGVTMMLVSLPMLLLYVVGYAFARRAQRVRSTHAKSS
jgi:sec-independent protein translocase protein TatC